MYRKGRFLLLLIALLLLCFQMGSTSGVTIDLFKALSDSKDSVQVYIINNNPNTKMTQFEVVAKYDAGDTSYRLGPKSGFYTIANLKSNRIYRIRGRAGFGNGTFLEFGEAKWARTAPELPTFTYIARPTFVILIILPTPGATKWSISYSEAKGDVSKRLYVPDGTNGQYYSTIIKNLRPNFRYTCYVHVTEIDHKTITNMGSPILGSFNTAPLSLFGRVLSVSAPFQTDFTNQWKREVEDKLKVEYIKLSSSVSEVRIIEVGNDTSGFPLIHHEVFLGVNDKVTVDSSKYVLPKTENFKDSKIYFNVAGNISYAYVGNNLWSALKPMVGCQWTDKRTWTMTNDKLKSFNLTLQNAHNSRPSVKTNVHLNGRDILSGRNHLATLSENTINAIGYDYLIKYCPIGSNLTFYDRIYKATANGTTLQNQYGIIYTTGPEPMPNDNKSVIIRTATLSSLIIKISVPTVDRAIRYDFYINSKYSNFFSENITLLEKYLDSSPRIEVSTLKNVTRFNFYVLSMQVTTRLANGSTASSPISQMTFYTGVPNQIQIRIVESYPDRFTVVWQPKTDAEGYVIHVESMSSKRTFKVSSNVTEFVVEKLVFGQKHYVKVAGFNNFGLAHFSNKKSNEIWSLSNITQTSMQLAWEGETMDELYVVSFNNTQTKTKTSSATISGLKSGETYLIQVSFHANTKARRLLFQTSQITRKFGIRPPKAPQNLRVIAFSHGSLSVGWDHVTGVDHYKVDIHGPSTTLWLTSTTNHLVLTKLAAGSSYVVKVCAVNVGGISCEQVHVDTSSENLTSMPDHPTTSIFHEITTFDLNVDDFTSLATEPVNTIPGREIISCYISPFTLTMISLTCVALFIFFAYLMKRRKEIQRNKMCPMIFKTKAFESGIPGQTIDTIYVNVSHQTDDNQPDADIVEHLNPIQVEKIEIKSQYQPTYVNQQGQSPYETISPATEQYLEVHL